MKKYLLCFMIICGAFFLFCSNCVSATDVFVNNIPKAEDIVYGQPLFSSKFSEGKANVEGVFYWKEEDKVLDVGRYTEKVIFDPIVEGLDNIELEIEINVLPRKIYLKFANPFYKQYDGSNRIEVPSYIVGGIIDKGVYLSGVAEAKLESVFVGENIKVIITGLEVKGERKDNYYLNLEGNLATIHPSYIEEFGENKNRVSFSRNTIIPHNSLLSVKLDLNNNLRMKKHKIKHVYSLMLESNRDVVKVSDEVFVRVKIDEENLNYKRLNLYNYYDGKYEKITYEYSDGYLSYKSSGLGNLVITQKNFDYSWVIIIATIGLVCLVFFVCKSTSSKDYKISKYKSLKRRKDYGDYH